MAQTSEGGSLERRPTISHGGCRALAPEACGPVVNHVSLSVFRFDREALVTPHLARLAGHDSPLLHLRRQGAGGMFDRFAEHAEELWSRAVPVA